MKKKLIFFLAGSLLFGIFVYFLSIGISNNTQEIKSNDKLQISTSFYPLFFFSSQIGGEKAEVINITPSGTEPHDYDPTLQDIVRIENGDMLVINGGVETWADKIKDNLKGKKTKIVIAGEGLFTKDITENGQKMQDTHIWLSPQLAKKQVKKITEGFITIDPKDSNYYNENEKILDGKLDKLDSDYKQGLANCLSKDIITSHAAFAYLVEAYGLKQVPIAGFSPDEEPSAQQLAEIANFAKQNHIKYIFFESLLSPKLSETIANEVGAQTLVLDPIEGISDDDIKQGKNYFTVMESNLKNLQIALGCSS